MPYRIDSISHHADEGVYRLTFHREIARQIEHPVEREVEWITPDPVDVLDEATGETVTVQPPDEPDGPPVMVVLEDVVEIHAMPDVVWSADDTRWEGMDADAIKAVLKAEVQAVLDERAATEEREEAARAAATTDLGGAGEAL